MHTANTAPSAPPAVSSPCECELLAGFASHTTLTAHVRNPFNPHAAPLQLCGGVARRACGTESGPACLGVQEAEGVLLAREWRG